MWRHVATEAERSACAALLRGRSVENSFAAVDARIPAGVKTARDGAPVGAAATTIAGATGETPNARSAGGGAGTNRAPSAGPSRPAAAAQTQQRSQQAAEPQGTTANVNTTRFPHMPPDLVGAHSDLPPLDEVRLEPRRKREFLDTGLADPQREVAAKRWQGTHFLGSGATGNCSHWVLTDENGNVEEVRRLVCSKQLSLFKATQSSKQTNISP